MLLFPVLSAVSDRKDRTMTNNLNSVIIEGTVGKVEPIQKTEAGTSYISFDVAVNRYYKTGDEISSHSGQRSSWIQEDTKLRSSRQ